METFEIATKTLYKQHASNENVNTEKGFYQAWSMTKVGVILGTPWQKKLMLFVQLFLSHFTSDTATASESGDYIGL